MTNKYNIGDKIKANIHYQNDSRTEVEAVIRGIELEDDNTIRYKIFFNSDNYCKDKGCSGCIGYIEQNDIIGLSCIETNPIEYKFTVSITAQSVIKDGEEYLDKLMKYYSDHNFKIINGCWRRSSVSHNRLGEHNPYNWKVIISEIIIERTVKDIHSPSDYIDSKLHDEIYEIFNSFTEDVIKNSDNFNLDYIKWINESWIGIGNDYYNV